jgi:hypothetical protein
VSLIARHLEEQGIATVVMGCARDIVEHAFVPRFYWSDFPLGHSAGKPADERSQRATLMGALELFEAAKRGGVTVENPQRWADNDDWQQDFMDLSKLSEAQLERARTEFVAHKRAAAKFQSG